MSPSPSVGTPPAYVRLRIDGWRQDGVSPQSSTGRFAEALLQAVEQPLRTALTVNDRSGLLPQAEGAFGWPRWTAIDPGRPVNTSCSRVLGVRVVTQGSLVEAEFVALDVLHHEARFVFVIGR
jgi:hypothetical protein